MAAKAPPDELFDPLRKERSALAPVRIDLLRYPRYGGQKMPAECSVCGRFKRCVETDGTGEKVCPGCVQVAIQVAQDQEIKPSQPSSERGYVYDDEQCPARGTGLNHTQNGGPYCVHCGKPCWHREHKLG